MAQRPRRLATYSMNLQIRWRARRSTNSGMPDPEVLIAQGRRATPHAPHSGLNKDIEELGHWAAGLPSGLVSQMASNFNAGKDLAASGAADLRAGNYLPSFPSTDPRTWTGGAVAKLAGGGLAALGSPFSAATSKLVSEPVTEMTGNPEIGARAGDVANLIVGNKFLAPKGCGGTSRKSGPKQRCGCN